VAGTTSESSCTASLAGVASDVRRESDLGILKPICKSGNSRMLRVCSIMLLLWPSVRIMRRMV
jgi:hypothetical protein